MLSNCETLELQQLEGVIERGLQGFYEAGQVLGQIRDKKLYRAEYRYSSFEAYCQERWQIGRQRAYQLISAAQVVAGLSTQVDTLPESEKQTRPLTSLPPEQQAPAWQAAQQIAGGNPTPDQVRRASKAAAQPRQWQTGQQLTVTREQSPFFGETVTVVEGGDDIIIKAQRTDGSFEPFLRNELSDSTAPIAATEKAWTAQRSKPDRLEALEATLQVEQIRVQVLETMLSRVLNAVRANNVNPDLVAEAEALLS